MKRYMVLAALTMTVTSVAKADLYTDRASVYQERARIAAKREQQQKTNEALARISAKSARFEQLLRGFSQVHGGLATDGVCTVMTPNFSYGMVHFDNSPQVPLSQVLSQAVAIRSCNVTLNDGLACSVDWARDGWEFRDNAVDAGCYDTNSNYKTYRYPGSSAKQPVAKRRGVQKR